MKKPCYAFWAITIPLLLGVITGISLILLKVPSITLSRLEFLLNTIISCSATISGFILASVTILVGAVNSEIMNEIRKKGALPELQWRYTEALVLGLLVIIYFAFLGATVDTSNTIESMHVAISASLLIAYISSVVITCYYLLSVIGLINDGKSLTTQEPSIPSGEFR